MNSNRRMQKLLERLGISSDRILRDGTGEVPELKSVDGCVFLAMGYKLYKGATFQQFHDRTGFECAVNEAYFRVGRGRRALERVLDYASGLRQALLSLREGRFEIIISVSNGNSTVRFHKWHPGESWLDGDLEEYKLEAILTITVQP